jgi:hypothetical protein
MDCRNKNPFAIFAALREKKNPDSNQAIGTYPDPDKSGFEYYIFGCTNESGRNNCGVALSGLFL